MQHATAIAVSIPLEIATFLRNRGDEPATCEDVAIAINRSEDEIQKHATEARRILRRMRTARS